MKIPNPLQGRIRRTPFVGRNDECRAIGRLMDLARGGQGGILMISGEAGLGKTRLGEEMAAEARAKGFNTFTGHCYEMEGTLPYIPFVEIFESIAQTLPGDSLRSVLGDAAPEVAKLVPDIRRVLPDTPAPRQLPLEQERHFLFNRIGEFIDRFASQRPLMILLEDLHWADNSTLFLLQHLAPRFEALPLLVLGTYREEDLDPGGPLAGALEDLIRRRLAERLRLKRLSGAEVEAMLRSVSGQDPPGAVTRAVYRETGGNPFYVEEVFLHLSEEGKLFDPGGRWRSATGLEEADLPDSIRLVLGRRIERLSQNARNVLSTAAVIGTTFDLSLLEAVTGTLSDALLDVLEEAERAHLIVLAARGTESGFAFDHELIRQTLLASISKPRRERLHAKIAEAIVRLHPHDAEQRAADVAQHLYLAGAVANSADTTRYVTLAGEQAMAARDYEGAARYFERALHTIEPAQREQRPGCELTLRLATACWSAGDLERARDCFTRAAGLAKALRAGELLASAVLGLGEGWGWVPKDLMARLLHDVLEVLPEHDDALRARTMARLAMELHAVGDRIDNQQEREDLSRRAVEMARRIGDPATLAYALGCWGSVFLEVADAQDRLTAASEAINLAQPGFEESTDPHKQRIIALLQLGSVAGLDEETETLRRLAVEHDEPFTLWEALRFKAMLALLAGRFQDAERLMEEHLALARRMGHARGATLTYAASLLVLRWHQGRVEERLVPTLAGVARHPQDDTSRAALAFIYSVLRQPEDARRHFDAATAGDVTALPHRRSWVITAVLLAQACAFVRSADKAAGLYGILLPFAGQHLTGRGDAYLGPADRYLALLADTAGRPEDAARHFERALQLGADAGALPFVALTQYDFAQHLLAHRRRGHRAKARELLEAALGTADDLGMVGLAADARRLLGGPLVAAGAVPGKLSPREVEVLRLLANGRSTREIGEELVLSVRTVERHISNIYRKIDVRNRAQATSFAIEHGLAAPGTNT